MGSRYYVGIEQKDGSVSAIYVHSGSGVEAVELLNKNYSNRENVEALISLGHCSHIGSEPKPYKGGLYGFEFEDVIRAEAPGAYRMSWQERRSCVKYQELVSDWYYKFSKPYTVRGDDHEILVFKSVECARSEIGGGIESIHIFRQGGAWEHLLCEYSEVAA